MATTELKVREILRGGDAIADGARITLRGGDIGPERTGTLFDDADDHDRGGATTTTFDGAAATSLGVGTLRAELAAIGAGDRFPVVVLEADGRRLIALLDGAPRIAEDSVLTLDLSEDPATAMSPMGFAAGTRLRTPIGDARVENLSRGDMVVSPDGSRHEILWIGYRDVTLPVALDARLERLLPFDVQIGALGEARPYRTLTVAPNLRLALEGAHVELAVGESPVLAAAQTLEGARIVRQAARRQVRLYHLLCERHAILLADGLPVASLLPADVVAEGMGREEHDDLLTLFPPLSRVCWVHDTCKPVARILSEEAAREAAQAQYRLLEPLEIVGDDEEPFGAGSGWPRQATLRSA